MQVFVKNEGLGIDDYSEWNAFEIHLNGLKSTCLKCLFEFIFALKSWVNEFLPCLLTFVHRIKWACWAECPQACAKNSQMLFFYFSNRGFT
jgi:hypothetical protein